MSDTRKGPSRLARRLGGLTTAARYPGHEYTLPGLRAMTHEGRVEKLAARIRSEHPEWPEDHVLDSAEHEYTIQQTSNGHKGGRANGRGRARTR